MTDGIPVTGKTPHSFWLYEEPNGYNTALAKLGNCSITVRSAVPYRLSGWKVADCASQHHFICQRIEEGKLLYSRVDLSVNHCLSFKILNGITFIIIFLPMMKLLFARKCL